MIAILVWCIILLGLSGWEYQSNAGDFGLIKWQKGAGNYKTWSDTCATSPYNLFSPFEFTFQQFNVTKGGSKTLIFDSVAKTMCPWGSSNSSFRFVILVFGMLCVFALFFHTKFSLFARSISAGYALLFFAAFVLDSNASAVGLAECNNGFINTKLSQDLLAANVVLSCTNHDYGGLSFVDLLISALFFLLHTAWGMCKNLYGLGEDSGNAKEINQQGALDELSNEI